VTHAHRPVPGASQAAYDTYMLCRSTLAIAAWALLGIVLFALMIAGLSYGAPLWIRAHSFVPATGVVVLSEVRERPGRHGPQRYSVIQYDYEVAGVTHRSSRVTLDDDTTPTWAQRFPTGAAVTVWHDPRNPAEATLERRVTRVFLLILLGAIMAGSMAVAFVGDAVESALWRSRRLSAGVVVRPTPTGAALRIWDHPPVVFAAYGTFGSSIIAIIIWTVLALVQTDPLFSAAEGWSIIALSLVPGLVVYCYQRKLVQGGRRDLAVDLRYRTLVVPPGLDRRDTEHVSMDCIIDIQVIPRVHPRETRLGTTFLPTLICSTAAGGERHVHIVEWRDQARALALTHWLQSQVDARSAKVETRDPSLGAGPPGAIMTS
jgi:hypothetical protein